MSIRYGKLAQQGFTLIEVLVSFLIMATGLLGMVTLLTTSVKANQGAYSHSQAIVHAQDMADKIRANRGEDYTSVTAAADSSCVVTGTLTACNNMAANDLETWRQSVQGTMPGADVVVCIDSTPDDGDSPSSAACDDTGTVVAVKIWWRDTMRDDVESSYSRYVASIR